MGHWYFDLTSAPNQREELDAKLVEEILALDRMGRGGEIRGEVLVSYSDQDAKNSACVAALKSRGIYFSWMRATK